MGEYLLDVAWHGAFVVVPVKVNSGKFGTLPVLSDGVALREDAAEMKGVEIFNFEIK